MQSSLITKVVENFDKADSSQDGKVSSQEAIAYDQANPTTNSSSNDPSSTSSTTAIASSDKTNAQIFRLIIELMRSHGSDGQSSQSVLSLVLSTVA